MIKKEKNLCYMCFGYLHYSELFVVGLHANVKSVFPPCHPVCAIFRNILPIMS